MKTVIEMAQEAGLAFASEEFPDIWNTYINPGRTEIERFAALVCEEVYKQDDITTAYMVGYQAGVDAEREKQQEPVAWMNPMNDAVIDAKKKKQIGEGNGYPNFSVPLYTTPTTAVLAARQMRDAAVKVCDVLYSAHELYEVSPDAMQYQEGKLFGFDLVEQAIAALPVPEVQWRDLTDDEINEAVEQLTDNGTLGVLDFALATIAAFKEKQL